MMARNWWQTGLLVCTAAAVAVGCGGESELDDEPQPPQLVVAQSVQMEAVAGESTQETLVVENEGDELLTAAFSVETDASWLGVEPQVLEIEGEDSGEVTLDAECPEIEGEYTGTLAVVSNDPDAAAAEVAVELDCQPLESSALTVDIQGLDEGVDADVELVGPRDFSASLTGTETLEELVPGDYQVSAFPVGDDARYVPVDDHIEVAVEPGEDVDVEIDYRVVTGGLEVSVEGLADGLEHDIEVVDEEGDARSVPQDGVVDELEPGAYTVEPAEVTDGGAVYAASVVDVTVISDEVTFVTVEYLVDYGSLSVDVVGLPSGVDHAVDLVDAEGQAVSLPQDGQMSALEPGSYTLEVADVEDGLSTYTAEDVGVEIESDVETSVTVEYELVMAQWELVIDGLPAGSDGAVSVVGGQLDTVVEETTSYDALEPGVYQIDPGSVTEGLSVYEAGSTEVELESGDNGTLTVSYELVMGSLAVSISGLPDGVDASVQVRDSADTVVATLDSSQGLGDLEPDTYTIDADDVFDGSVRYEAASQVKDIASGSAALVHIDYTAAPGDLTVGATGLDGLDLVAEVTGPGYSQTVTGAGTLTDLQPGDYSVQFHDVVDGNQTYRAQQETVAVAVESDETAGADADYEVVTGELTVDATGLGGLDLIAEVTGPSGTESITGAETLTDLEPGDYTVTFEDVTDSGVSYRPVDPSVSVQVSSEQTAEVVGSYDVVTGDLAVDATGLDGLGLVADVTGPSVSTTVYGAQTLTDLEPGDYTVEFQDVVDGGRMFQAQPATVTVTVESEATAEADTDYELLTGDLIVDASGLGGLDLIAEVTGPSGTESITGAQTLTDLEPGDYTVTFEEVSDAGVIYQPSEPTVSVPVSSEQTAEVVGTYDVVTGDLTVDATGLEGYDLVAEVNGPSASLTISGAQTLTDLEPGEYTVNFTEVSDGPAVYRAEPQTVQVDVLSDETATATGDYAVVFGELVVTADFLFDVEFELDVVDADGQVAATKTVTGSETVVFSELRPEHHSLEPADPITDVWGNEYIDLEGFGESIAIESEETSTAAISGVDPTVVFTEYDDGDYSLRAVLDRVNAGTVVTFADGVQHVTIDGGQIDIDVSLSIVGHDEEWVDIEVLGDHRALTTADGVELSLQALRIGGGHTDGYGGAIRAGGDVTLFDVELYDNYAEGRGGAIHVDGDLTLYGVTMRDNEVIRSATTFDGYGGALVADHLDAEDVKFINNVAERWGGAIYAREDISVMQGRFEANQAEQGGAIRTSIEVDVDIDRSLFVDNEATDSNGGALYLATDAYVTNSTLYGNEAADRGGAVFKGADGLARFEYVSVVGNDAETAPGIYHRDWGNTQMELSRTFIADNGDSTQSELVTEDGAAVIESGGYNFISRVDDSDFVDETSDYTGSTASPLEPHIRYYGYNGGSPETVSLESDSLAYQAIPEGECVDVDGNAVLEDQRGYTRPVDGACTIGAWQADPNFETFDEATDLPGNTYADGSFVGDEGFEWHYEEARSESGYDIDGAGLMLRDATARLWADDIPDGIETFSVQYRKAFTGSAPRQFEVVVDGAVVETSPVFGDFSGSTDTVHTLVVDDIGVGGDFDLEIRNVSPTGGNAQIVFDNVRWE